MECTSLCVRRPSPLTLPMRAGPADGLGRFHPRQTEATSPPRAMWRYHRQTGVACRLWCRIYRRRCRRLRDLRCRAQGPGVWPTWYDARVALVSLKAAISRIAEHRATLGAIESRLSFTNSQLTSTKENMAEAKSRITDVNVAEEATNFARFQILAQSGTSMLSQANAMPKTVLQLLT